MLQTVKSDLRLYPSKNQRERENNGKIGKNYRYQSLCYIPIFLSIQIKSHRNLFKYRPLFLINTIKS